MPIDFEEALKRLQKAEGLERGPAIDRLHSAWQAGDPELAGISDFNSSMVAERAKSIAERAGIGAFEGIETPAEELIRAPGKLFGYGSNAPTYGEEAAQAVRSQTETTPYAEGVGEVAGSALPFTTLEKGAALLPLIGRSGIARQIIAGGILERADTGRNTVLGSVVAPVALPWVLEKAAGMVAQGARTLFGRGADVLPDAEATIPKIDPKAVVGMTNAPETPATEVQGEGFTMKPKPIPEVPPEPGEIKPPGSMVETAPRTVVGRGVYEPPVSAPQASSVAETDSEFVGTRDTTTGKPFEGTQTRLLSTDRGRVFVNANHPNAELGTPTPVKVANPAVFNVQDNPYRDALEQVWSGTTTKTTTDITHEAYRDEQGRWRLRPVGTIERGTIEFAQDVTPSEVLAHYDTPKARELGIKVGIAGEGKPLSGSAQILDAFDRTDDPEGFAREQLGRWAKSKKFDSIVLRSKDPANDILLDFKDFKASPHPAIGRGMSANLVNPPRSIFAKKAPTLYTPEEDAEAIQSFEWQIGRHEERLKRHLEDFGEDDATARFRQNIKELKDQIAFIKGGRKGFAKEAEQKPFKSGDLQHIADAYGFDDPLHMARAIRASRATPFELYQSEVRMPRAPLPDIMSARGKASIEAVRKFNPEYADAIQAVADRHPRKMNLLTSLKIGDFGENYPTTFALTHMDETGSIHMILNTRNMHLSPEGDVMMRRAGWDGRDPREFYATTLEHELTHVAQFWADVRGLHKTLGVPDMSTAEEGPQSPVERQAYERDYKLQDFFAQHQQMREMLAGVPDDVKAQILKADIENQTRIMRPILARKFNKLKGEPSVKVWAKEIPGFDPEDLGSFDSDSRSLFDSQFDPDRLISPEVKSLIDRMHQYGLKFWASFRRPFGVSDHPAHLSFISRIYELARDKDIKIDKLNRVASGIMKEFNINEKNYDQIFEAVENLRRMPDGSLRQLLPDLDPNIARAATRIRETITDPIYEHITGIDRRAPAILKELNLSDTEAQWTRIKNLQLGLTDKVKKPLMNEVEAAKRMQGMLNFTEGHDIRGGFVDGYITNQPIKNERAALIDQIHQLQTLNMDPATQAEMMKKVKRLDEIETAMVNQKIKGLPARDTVPKHHFFGPVNVRDHPGAAEVLVDKNIRHIMGRYINGAVTKSFFDQALHEFRKVADELPPSVRDYDTNYLNNLRGVRGYREDIGLVNAINSFNEKVGLKKRVNLSDVRGATHRAMQWNMFFKLFANQVRFPIIQASHVLLTDGVVDPWATTKGVAYVLAKPKQAMLEAMAKGIIERDAEFLGAMDEVSPSTQGQILKYATAMSKYSDYFRKAVTYHGFRLRAMEPNFKPSPVIRTFIRDVAGRNTIQMARDYGAAATDILQFRLRAEGKPQAFVGGVGRRLWGQFKQWPINIGGLYGDIIKSGDNKMIGRMLGTLWFFGGMSFGGGEMLYNAVRHEMLKRGHILPQETGWQTILNQAGIGESLQNVNILSLKDPIGAPRSFEDIPSWIAGPTFGAMYDYGKQILADHTGPAQAVKATISAISPQARAGLDAYEEFKHGGVVDPTGRVLAMREPAAIVIRGLDLSPSVRTQRYQIKQDIITALEAGQRDTAMELLDSARKKGLVFGPKDLAEIKAKVKHTIRQRGLFGQDWGRLLQ